MASASSDIGSDDGHHANKVAHLRLPAFPPGLLMPNWKNNRADATKLNLAAYSIRCTLSAMCGMHVHTMGDMRKHDIFASCERNYLKLVAAMQNKYRDAAVVKYLGHTSLTKVAVMTGEKVFRMAQNTRKTIVNRFNPKWKACLVNGQPPSGKNWEWVAKRVLIMLYHESKGDTTHELAANAGIFFIFFVCLHIFFAYVWPLKNCCFLDVQM